MSTRHEILGPDIFLGLFRALAKQDFSEGEIVQGIVLGVTLLILNDPKLKVPLQKALSILAAD